MRSLGLVVLLVVTLAVPLGTAPASATTLDRDPTTLSEVLDSFGYRPEHADVLRLYSAFFERDPDPAGSLYWMQQFDEGASLDDMAWAFSASTEFVSRYGDSLSDDDFLRIVYTNVLGRTPDAEGFDYWLGQMRAGLAQHEVVRWVTANDEFELRHPFAGTAPSLALALATPSDHGPDWTSEEAQITSGAHDCSNLTRLPAGGVSRHLSGKIGFISYQVDHGLYAFANESTASSFMARRQATALACNGNRSGSGSTTWVQDGPIGSVGNERAGVIVSAGIGDVVPANGIGVIMVRRGNVVSISIGGSGTSYGRAFHEDVQVDAIGKLDALAD